MLVRCSLTDPPDAGTVLDAVLASMLSLQWVQQKLGLDCVIIRTTTECGGSLHQNTYHPLHYTHNGASHTNLCKRFAVVKSATTQWGEV